jgi:hypothetical protein
MKPVAMSANRLIADRQRKRERKLHEDRLKAINGRKKGKTKTLDNKPPRTIGMTHLIVNKKRDHQVEERFDEIERQNRLLLAKMTKIMKKKAFDFPQTSAPKSLNLQTRRRKMLKINQDNQLLLERINKITPMYDRSRWKKERKENEHLIKNLSKFHPDDLFKPVSTSRNKKGATSSASVPTRPATTNMPGSMGKGRGGRNIKSAKATATSAVPLLPKPQLDKVEEALEEQAKEDRKAQSDLAKSEQANEDINRQARESLPKSDEIQVAEPAPAKPVEPVASPISPTDTVMGDGKTPEESIVESVFAAIDPGNTTKTLSKRKFLRGVQLNNDVQELLKSNPRLKPLLNVKELQNMFAEIDENHDGEVSVEEMVSFASKMNVTPA